MSAPLPPSPPATASAQRFITGLGWTTIALGAAGVGLTLIALLPSAALTADDLQRLLDPLGTGQVQVPSLLQWVIAHDAQLSVAELLLSAPMLWLGRGLLRRREWARVGYLVSLVVGALLTFGLIWLVPALLDSVLAASPGLQVPGRPLPAALAGIRTAATALSAVIALILAALHGALAWKLCSPGVRAQFRTCD